MSDTTMRCDVCTLALAECSCATDGDPAEGDLVTADLAAFFLWGPRRDGPAFRVTPGDDWKAVVLTWMYRRKSYPAVWLVAEHGHVPLDLGDPSDAEGRRHV